VCNERLDLDLKFCEVKDQYTYKDHNIKVTAISTRPDTQRKPDKQQKLDDSTMHSYEAMQYICEGPEVVGAFDIKAAKALNVPPGPLYCIIMLVFFK